MYTLKYIPLIGSGIRIALNAEAARIEQEQKSSFVMSQQQQPSSAHCLCGKHCLFAGKTPQKVEKGVVCINFTLVEGYFCWKCRTTSRVVLDAGHPTFSQLLERQAARKDAV
jgi:hypothetical protein